MENIQNEKKLVGVLVELAKESTKVGGFQPFNCCVLQGHASQE